MGKGIKIYGATSGEGIIYETTNEKFFVVDTQTQNRMTSKSLCRNLTNNYKCITRVIQVIPVNDTTHEPVEYYSEERPREGHLFMIVDPNDVIWYTAIVDYNNQSGFIHGKPISIRYEIINLKEHRMNVQKLAMLSGVHTSRKTGLADATRFNKTMRNGNSKTRAMNYLHMDQDAEYIMSIVEETNHYSNSAVSAALAFQGNWSANNKRDYKIGEFVGYNITYGSDVRPCMDFLKQLRDISRGRLELTCGKCTTFAKFYHTKVHALNEEVNFTKILNFLEGNPNKAFGKPCPTCDQLIDGYVDRINKAGEKGHADDWESIYLDMTREPGF